MGKNILRDWAAYIPIGSGVDTLAGASRDRLCTHEARVSPPTN